MTTEEQLKLMANMARKYVSFKSVKVMCDTVRKYESMFKLKGKILEFLNALKEYSCVSTGVSYRKRSKWAEIFKVSERTIKRWLDKLSKLGIIKDIPAFEPSGRQMWNHVVIQPLPVVDKVEEKQEVVTPSGDNVSPLKNKSLKQNLNINNKRNEDVPFDANAVHTEIPKIFVQMIATRFNNASTIEKLWSKFKLAFNNNYKAATNETPELHAKDAINIVLAVSKSAKEGKLRKGNSMDSIYGAVYGLTAKLSKQWSKVHIAKHGSTNSDMPFFNWLEN